MYSDSTVWDIHTEHILNRRFFVCAGTDLTYHKYAIFLGLLQSNNALFHEGMVLGMFSID